MKAKNNILLSYHIILVIFGIFISSSLGNETNIEKLPENKTSTTSIEESEQPELVANDTSTAEQILDYLIENNSAVNFALKRGNNKRKQQNDAKKDAPLSLDQQINNRITSYLSKKQEKLNNVTALETKINETLETLFEKKESKEDPVELTTEKVKVPPSLPPFFSNAYNRVVHLLGNNKTENGPVQYYMPPKPPKKPSEAEILAMAQTERPKEVITSKPLVLEDTINEIGSQLIGSLTTKIQEIQETSTQSTTTTTTSTPEAETPAIVETTKSEPSTTKAPIKVKKTTVKLTTTTTQRNTIQKLGDRVGGLLERLGINKGKTDKPPTVLNNKNNKDRVTYSYETPSSTMTSDLGKISDEPPTQKPESNIIVQSGNIIKEETVESINNVQTFLNQFGVTLNNFAITTTQKTVPTTTKIVEEMSDESIRMPTTMRTRRPYPWTTTRYRPYNDAQTIPSDFEEMETTTKRFFPTSFWRKTTTTMKPTIRYPTRMPSNNKISSELSDANLIDTDNKNITMVKISVVNAGCQSEKSVLMLFNKNQKVLISVDTSDGSDQNAVEVENNEVKPKPQVNKKPPNGVELIIDEDVTESETETNSDDTRLEQDETELSEPSTKAPTTTATKPSKAPVTTTTKSTKATRTTRGSRTTTKRVRNTRTTRARTTRRPAGQVEYDENEVPTTKTKKKRRRTKGNKRKSNRNKNRKGAATAIPITNSTVLPDVVPLKTNSTK